MTLVERISDVIHWALSLLLIAAGVVVDNGNEIIIFCGVISALIQVFIQIKRVFKKKG